MAVCSYLSPALNTSSTTAAAAHSANGVTEKPWNDIDTSNGAASTVSASSMRSGLREAASTTRPAGAATVIAYLSVLGWLNATCAVMPRHPTTSPSTPMVASVARSLNSEGNGRSGSR